MSNNNTITPADIEAKITKYEKEREEFRQGAIAEINNRISFFNGQIDALNNILNAMRPKPDNADPA